MQLALLLQPFPQRREQPGGSIDALGIDALGQRVHPRRLQRDCRLIGAAACLEQRYALAEVVPNSFVWRATRLPATAAH